MKKVFCLAMVMICSLSFFAQNDLDKLDDENRIAMTCFVGERSGVPDNVQKMLVNKMNQMVLKTGMGGKKNQRFVFTTNVEVITEDVTPTAPPKTLLNVRVNFYVGDGITGQLFSNASVEVQGVGNDKGRAFMAALNKVKVTEPSIQECLNEGKKRIIEYYNTQCDFILKEALAAADRKEFDEALSQLLAVPNVCKDCYDKAQDEAVKIYKRKIENDCQMNINLAKVAIAGNDWDGALNYLMFYTPDMECYPEVAKLITDIQDHRCADALAKAQAAWANRNSAEAAGWLADVSADSKCYPEAQKLQKDIAAKLDADEKREWDFKVQQHKDEVSLEKASIKAMRDIGVAYGENQQPVTYNVVWW